MKKKSWASGFSGYRFAVHLDVVCVTEMDVLNLKSMIKNHFVQKTILSEDRLSDYITKLFYDIIATY